MLRMVSFDVATDVLFQPPGLLPQHWNARMPQAMSPTRGAPKKTHVLAMKN